MIHNRYGITLAGGLILMLLTTACASKPARTAANPPPKDQAVATDRVASTERQVPSNRAGTGDPRTATDRVVPCADDRGDMTASADCAPRGNDQPSQAALAACANHKDAKGRIVFDDPACASRYRTEMGSSYENVNWSRESAFFDRYMDKAVKHAREAEIAGKQGHAPEMLRHAELSLEQAKEAQRAGNVLELNEGIIALRDTLLQGQMLRTADWPSDREARRATTVPGTTEERTAVVPGTIEGQAPMVPGTSEGRAPTAAGTHEGIVASDERTSSDRYATTLAAATDRVREARIKLSQAAGMKSRDTAVATPAGMGSRTPRVVKGEVVSDAGNHQYVLRDRSGKDTRIVLSPDLNRDLKAGDMVEAQLDSDGRVVGINNF